MVKIRLMRIGKKNRPSFRIGAFDIRSQRDGKCLENLGQYDVLEKNAEKQIVLHKERILHWLRKGAQPTETVALILKKHGVTLKPAAAAAPKAKEAAPAPPAEAPKPA
ncbi:MAG: 30S ribosomal protein S16 [Planctomycetes bacterium]|nr:30S ribosomal protein S16 [Planctomycetota bacterium]MBM4080846.1 30S ribosomal protein S16 [Planctomycetota bacterium]